MLEVSPDDVCLVCGTVRDQHGDKNHKFSQDGQLIPLDPPPEPRMKAPRHRDDPPAPAQPGVDDGPNIKLAFATLVEVLVDKGILDVKDVLRIFRGEG